MKMRIIDIIELVDMRNKNLLSDKPMGINIDKYFMPSVANTIGVDLKTYKLVPHNCFACNLMHVGRDERVPMAINKKEDPVLVSPAYLVFRVKESVDVLPDFLMLSFRRPTFDRNAWFFTAGDVRGGLDKKDFFNMEVHVPDIATQRRIVAEYQAVEKRIIANEQLISKLEETAQTIYKKMFVDDIDLGHLPEGWEISSFVKNVDIKGGGTPSTDIEEFWNGNIKFFSPKDCTGTPFCIDTIGKITELGVANSSTRIYKQNTVFITARGTVGNLCIAGCDMAMNQSCFALLGLNGYGQYFIYHLTKSLVDRLASYANGAVFSALTVKDFQGEKVVFPSVKSVTEFEKCVKPIYAYILAIEYECEYLNSIRSLLLSKMS